MKRMKIMMRMIEEMKIMVILKVLITMLKL
jgi:hypothetical protein